MVKICFLGISVFVETEAIIQMRKELVSIFEQEDEIEFWLHGCHNLYEKKAVGVIMDLKAEYPDKKITIVDVVDPVKSERLDTGEMQEKADGFLKDSVNRFEYAPRFEGKLYEHRNRFIAQAQKVDSWMRRQCDYLIAYSYDNLPDSINTFIKRSKAYTRLTVISVAIPSTSKRIDELIDELEGREKTIVAWLRDGRTAMDIASELGISHNRVKQIASRGAKRIRLQIKMEIE